MCTTLSLSPKTKRRVPIVQGFQPGGGVPHPSSPGVLFLSQVDVDVGDGNLLGVMVLDGSFFPWLFIGAEAATSRQLFLGVSVGNENRSWYVLRICCLLPSLFFSPHFLVVCLSSRMAVVLPSTSLSWSCLFPSGSLPIFFLLGKSVLGITARWIYESGHDQRRSPVVYTAGCTGYCLIAW